MAYGVMQRGLWWVVSVLWLLGSSAGVSAQDVQSWETAMAAGAKALDQGHYTEAVQRFRAALAIAEALTPENVPEEDNPAPWRVAASLMNLAAVYRIQGQYTDALPLYQRALFLYERMLGPEHPQLVDVLLVCADILRRLYPVRSRLPWSTANKLQARAWRIQENEVSAIAPAPPGSFVDDLSDIFRPSE
jgi:tetratricopeptide (TPR) repeat protein